MLVRAGLRREHRQPAGPARRRPGWRSSAAARWSERPPPTSREGTSAAPWRTWSATSTTIPAREEAVRLLALALYRSGRQGDALGALRALRSHLAEELGVDPSPALRALEADVLAQSPSLDASPSSSVIEVRATEVPEVPGVGGPDPAPAGAPQPSPVAQDDDALGREREVAQVLAAGEEARRTRAARLVWLAGEAGDGKTTVLSSLVGTAAARGLTTAWGRCTEVDGAPPGWPGRRCSTTSTPASWPTWPPRRRRSSRPARWPASWRTARGPRRCSWCWTTSTGPTA
ncbi:MAG: BTAD domain-containing putative transcriptional regulator [Quadrisphaera sp.]